MQEINTDPAPSNRGFGKLETMNLKQYLIGKKKKSGGGYDAYAHNHAIEEILSDLPQLEKKLMEEIGENLPMTEDTREYGTVKVHLGSQNVCTIIHNFFN